MIINDLESIFNEVFSKLNLPKEHIKIIKSNRPDLCDYQFDGVFKLVSILNKNPEEIGNLIINEINNNDYSYYFKSIEFVRPGFINIVLSDKYINDSLIKMNDNSKFNITLPKEETYIIDYGGYNIAKPLHIGHLRPTIIGESIKRILKYMGHNVIADVHLGDYGLQMGQVIYGILRDKKQIDEIDIDYLNKIYPEISALCKENEEVNKKCAEIVKSLQDNENTYRAYWNKIVDVSLEDIKKITNYFDVDFDLWNGESDAFNYFEPLEEILNKNNILKESEGARIIDVKKDDDNKPMPPMIFKKSNGAYLYDSTDLATIYERKIDYNPDHIIYVTDFRQKLHFEQVFRASDLAGIIPYQNLEHAYNGTINGKDNKPFKTRKGDAPRLSEIIDMVKETFISLKDTNKDMNKKDLDIIVNSIIKFAELQNTREKDYVFDIEKFSDVVGKTGPYILYTYVRINKILENFKESTSNLSEIIYNKEDRDLRINILDLEENLNDAYINRMPNYLANYIYDLCVLVNTFYQKNHLVGLENKQNLNDWVYILRLTNNIIKEMLKLLIIDVPSVM